MRFKKFHGNVYSVYYDDPDNYGDYYDFADDDEYRKIGSIRRLFKGFDKDYYKPIRSDVGFDGRINDYIEYMSRDDRYENLSPEEYLDMIRPYLRDLINYHKPKTRLSNEENNSDTNETNNNDDERGEWKIQLVMQNNCISTKNFEDTRTIYSASRPAEVFMGTDTNDTIDALFDTLLQTLEKARETLNTRGREFTQVLLYCIIIFRN